MYGVRVCPLDLAVLLPNRCCMCIGNCMEAHGTSHLSLSDGKCIFVATRRLEVMHRMTSASTTAVLLLLNLVYDSCNNSRRRAELQNVFCLCDAMMCCCCGTPCVHCCCGRAETTALGEIRSDGPSWREGCTFTTPKTKWCVLIGNTACVVTELFHLTSSLGGQQQPWTKVQ